MELSAAEQQVLELLSTIDPSPAFVEHLLWTIDQPDVEPIVSAAFGPRPRRTALMQALGNLYDHWLVTADPGGYSLTDAGRAIASPHPEQCGFCDNGKPLDTQEDWDNSWGRIWPGSEAPKVCRYCNGTGVVQ